MKNDASAVNQLSGLPSRFGRIKLMIALILAGGAFLTLMSLGVWQLNRLAWKEDLIARVTDRVDKAPVPLPSMTEWAELQPEEYQYRRVTMMGRFLHDREIHVYMVLSTPRGGAWRGQGVWVMTPLEQDDGTTIIVNRGFVPDEAKATAARDAGQVKGLVTVTGLMRMSEKPNFASPEDDVAGNLWYTRDVAKMTRAMWLERETTAPFFVDADASLIPGASPQGGETRISFPNRHLGYAITWFGLALSLLTVGLAYGLKQRRKGGSSLTEAE